MFKKRRLTQKQFEEKLKKINPDITVIGEYKSSNERVMVRCNKCGHEWSPLAASLLYIKSGCPSCHFDKLHAAYRKTHSPSKKKFVKLLAGKFPNIELISDYESLSRPITLRCKDCGHEWTRAAGLVLKSLGCPRCARKNNSKTKFLNKKKVFVERMAKINPNITILGEYAGSAPTILVKCNVCGKEWMASPNNLLRGRGCGDCYKRGLLGRKTPTETLRGKFEEKLASIDANVTIIGDYTSAKNEILVRCNDCGCEYLTTPSDLLRGGGKCPVCKVSGSGRRCKIVTNPVRFSEPSSADYHAKVLKSHEEE